MHVQELEEWEPDEPEAEPIYDSLPGRSEWVMNMIDAFGYEYAPKMEHVEYFHLLVFFTIAGIADHEVM